MSKQFLQDVEEGLSKSKKTIPSKYFYDKRGDELFIKIMHLPEYYLTRSELEIFQTKTAQIIEALALSPSSYFELIELGAGDGLKTLELLKSLEVQNFSFDYMPIDISMNALELIAEKLKGALPSLSIKKQQGDYFKILDSLKATSHPKVVLFLGSSIGNMEDEEAIGFLSALGNNLSKGDKLLLGVDLIKPASVVLPAYNDSQGVTRDFNLNLLRRINEELHGDFNLNEFEHIPSYSEEDGYARSYLKSRKDQKVRINGNGNFYELKEGEQIQTEVSRKYNDEIINAILEKTNFEIQSKITDNKGYFANYVLNRV
ncbi:L-histidine N(alpha)-methyltransferase [Saccharicrinis aurantiacus]|uniref:L-histidine N(alpha)-methyltransferase n=1 Tax=Saccharicrinis aurantiacus TaxID=1849719 RepID=UPI00248FFABC|nr:L-histidine N(alpha)-methyltransferase [Saccharicrinis aurantiacus]